MLKRGQEVFIKHLPFVRAVVVGPRLGDKGTPEEKTRVYVKIAEEKKLCKISELVVEQKHEAPNPADWDKATDALARWQQNIGDKELGKEVVEALAKVGLLK